MNDNLNEELRKLVSGWIDQQKKTAKDLGISAPSLNQMLKGVCGIPMSRFLQLVYYLRPPQDEVERAFSLYLQEMNQPEGSLNLSRKSGITNSEAGHADKMKTVPALNEQDLKEILSNNPSRSSEIRIPSGEGCFVPIITSAAAATCNPGLVPLMDCVNQYSEDKTWFKQAKEGDFVIEVTGTSMSPWYPDGTLLLVRPYQELRNGQRVVAVLDSGEIIFKIYAEKDGKICLLSINGDGKDFVFKKPIVPIRYICRVIASQRNEDALDEEMLHAHIQHNWQEKLEKI